MRNAQLGTTGAHRRASGTILVIMAAALLTGCGHHPATPAPRGTSSVNNDRTPAQAHAALREDLVSVATQVMPKTKPVIVDREAYS